MSAPGNILAFCGRLCMGTAACIALYLACNALGSTPLPGCEPGSPCSQALGSPWACVFGLPVSFPGLVIYASALLLSGAFVRRERSLAGLEASAALGAIVTSAIWFGFLQIAALPYRCLWCSLTQGLATAGAVFLCTARMRYRSASPEKRAKEQADARGAHAHALLSRLAGAGSAMICAGLLSFGSWSKATATDAPEIRPSKPATRPAATACIFEIQLSA
jgi:uncharacterized membrane protein